MPASVERTPFGKLDDGTPVNSFTLRSAGGMVAKIISYGATLTKLWVPDRTDELGDVVLGFDDLKGYLGEHPHLGGIIGRFANRIAKGKFKLEGKGYQLAINDPPNSLHGGIHGFDRFIWDAAPSSDPSTAAVRFFRTSPDGEEGFPGNLKVAATYMLTDENELRIDYSAEADKATPINLTNHSYFNFGGGSDVLGHVLQLDADAYTPVDGTLIPTGEIRSVAGTPMDFRVATAIGARIAQVAGNPGGYDHNFVVNGEAGELRRAARVYEPESGREMEVWTTEPGIQFYSGNFLDGKITGKRGVVYGKHSGFCLETQHYPDSVNRPEFPSVILRPGEKYLQTTVYRFSAR